jgi:hypothetical protein
LDFVVNFGLDHLDAHLGGEFQQLRLARLAEAGIARQHGNFGNSPCFHGLKYFFGSIGVLLRGLENISGHRVHDHLGGRAGNQRGSRLFEYFLDLHGLAGGGGPQHGDTFSSSMSCLAKEIAFSGLAPESLIISSTFLTVDAAGGIGLLHQHLQSCGLPALPERRPAR